MDSGERNVQLTTLINLFLRHTQVISGVKKADKVKTDVRDQQRAAAE